METKTKFTTEDRKLQADLMEKYRESGIIPTISTVSKETGVSYTTIAMFMQGNSRNQKIRDYLIPRLLKNLKPLPDDVKKLLDIWKEDNS